MAFGTLRLDRDNVATALNHQGVADRDPARHYLDSGYPSVIEKIYINFPQRACWTCDIQPEPATSKARQRGLTIYPRELHEIQHAALTAQGTMNWRADY